MLNKVVVLVGIRSFWESERKMGIIKKKIGMTCGSCKKFHQCVTISGAIIGARNTSEEIAMCSACPACPEFVKAGPEAFSGK